MNRPGLWAILSKIGCPHKFISIVKSFHFRENHSTTLALLDVIDQIYAHLDKHESVVGVYLDLEKAFDTANHAILLHKLYNYGIRGVVYEWFRNYLLNRTQFVTVNECNSEVKNIKHVPHREAFWARCCF